MRLHSTLEWRPQRRLRDAPPRSDADIEVEIHSHVIGKVVGVDPRDVAVSVDQGVVKMAGVVAERREAVRLERLAGKVPGVSRIESSITWEADTPHLGRRPRFAQFAKRRQGSEGRPASPTGTGNNKDHVGDGPLDEEAVE